MWVVVGRYFVHRGTLIANSDFLDEYELNFWKFTPAGILLCDEGWFTPMQYTYRVRSGKLYIESDAGEGYGISGRYETAIQDDRAALSRFVRLCGENGRKPRPFTEVERFKLIRFQGKGFNYRAEKHREYLRATEEGAVTITEEWVEERLQEEERKLFERLYAERGIDIDDTEQE